MILVDSEVKSFRRAFKDTNGVEDPDAYFLVRQELPYEGYMAYLDAAVSFELKGEAIESESAKMKISQIQAILMQYGLLEIHGVRDAKTQVELTADQWATLP